MAHLCGALMTPYFLIQCFLGTGHLTCRDRKNQNNSSINKHRRAYFYLGLNFGGQARQSLKKTVACKSGQPSQHSCLPLNFIHRIPGGRRSALAWSQSLFCIDMWDDPDGILGCSNMWGVWQ
eukprot:1158160-Pelagomonas_calceolata.AAC.1